MIRFVGMRLIGTIPLLLGIAFAVFALLHIAPASPLNVLAGGKAVDVQTLGYLRREYHLNDPFITQYLLWLGQVLHGDLGRSIVFRDTVVNVIRPRILPTVELAALAWLIILVVGPGLGVISAVRRGTKVGSLSSGTMVTISSLSPYISGLLLISVFAVGLGWFPIFGLGGGGLDRVYHLALPAIALAMGVMSLVGRTTQASLSRVLDEGYVEAARSRGYSEGRVLARHALRNALLPVVTIMGVSVGYLIVGAVLVEYTFGLNGLGSLLVQSVEDKDFPTVQGVTLMFAAAFVFINLIVDLLYTAINPQVRRSTAGGS